MEDEMLWRKTDQESGNVWWGIVSNLFIWWASYLRDKTWARLAPSPTSFPIYKAIMVFPSTMRILSFLATMMCLMFTFVAELKLLDSRKRRHD